MKELATVTHRKVTAVHFLENKKYMIWYHLENKPMKTIGIIQVRGINKPLTDAELKHHIDALWERYKQQKESKEPEPDMEF